MHSFLFIFIAPYLIFYRKSIYIPVKMLNANGAPALHFFIIYYFGALSLHLHIHLYTLNVHWFQVYDRRRSHLVPWKRAGIILVIMLFTKAPRTHRFVQVAMAVQMWRQGASQKLFSTLNHYGVTQSSPGAQSHVDRLGQHHDHALLQWKKEHEMRCLIFL